MTFPRANTRGNPIYLAFNIGGVSTFAPINDTIKASLFPDVRFNIIWISALLSYKDKSYYNFVKHLKFNGSRSAMIFRVFLKRKRLEFIFLLNIYKLN